MLLQKTKQIKTLNHDEKDDEIDTQHYVQTYFIWRWYDGSFMDYEIVCF